ncbi:unnamed protein product [Caenorhabditis bovis]|uniref:Yippee domain-containing protein n=1 Tax=Caenorhabditis bovis TaxID=2654633 RepID=A0A8S1FA39_9PELO|nr:unnamed protein product [Caenorhabditis bovis]
MGRVFIGNFGGQGILYGCKSCGIYLTSHGELTSPNFNGSTGPAMLFKRVWNVYTGALEKRKMTTGWHVVRDVSCLNCKARIGWMYEMAYETHQEYKEGQYILECELISREHAFSDPLGADKIRNSSEAKPPVINFERPPGRVRRMPSVPTESDNVSTDSENDYEMRRHQDRRNFVSFFTGRP